LQYGKFSQRFFEPTQLEKTFHLQEKERLACQVRIMRDKSDMVLYKEFWRIRHPEKGLAEKGEGVRNRLRYGQVRCIAVL